MLQKVMEYYGQHTDAYWQALQRHITISLEVVIISIVIGVPLGIACAKWKKSAKFISGFVNFLRVVPSLALMVILIPLMGIGRGTAIVALTLIATPSIMINTTAGFLSIELMVLEVAKGMGLDRRIGNKFLNPGPGYGGSCFPKDTNAMACMGRKYGASLSLIEAAIRGNDLRKTKMAERILNMVKAVPEAKVAVWGLAFKNGTDDVRCSPALQIVEQMLRSGANICVYDPKAMDNARKILGDEVKYAQNAFEAAKDADVLAILTEWNDFAEVNLTELKAIMRSPKVVDLRNMLKSKQPQLQGFEYRCIGLDS